MLVGTKKLINTVGYDQDQTESWQIYPETWAEVPSLEASWHFMDNLENRETWRWEMLGKYHENMRAQAFRDGIIPYLYLYAVFVDIFLVKVKHIVALVSPYSYLAMCAGKVLGGALKPFSTFGLVEHMTIKADRAGWLSPSRIRIDCLSFSGISKMDQWVGRCCLF